MTQISPKARRSLLFVPGARPERFSKAVAAGADMVCIDLEDATPPQHKDAARVAALEFIANHRGPVELVLRINSPRTVFGLRDLLALSELPGPRALTLMLPKVEAAADIEWVDQMLTQHRIDLIALLESARAIDEVNAIASASPRLSALMLGGADLSVELRGALAWDTLTYARGRLVAAASRFRLDLIDVPFIDVADGAGLEVETARVRAMGFTTKAAIHPSQVVPINREFTPSQAQIEHARRVLDAYASVAGGAVLLDGKLVDTPIYLAAKQVMGLVEALNAASATH